MSKNLFLNKRERNGGVGGCVELVSSAVIQATPFATNFQKKFWWLMAGMDDSSNWMMDDG
jgi:hypothetical protein